MPSNTAFYMLWRGAPSAEARKANSLFALWDDANLASGRQALLDNFLPGSDSKSKLSREELDEYLTLLENPFVVGYLSKPRSAATMADSGNVASLEKTLPWNGMFFIYDRTGKEALLRKAVLRAGNEAKAPQVSQVTIGNVKGLKFQRSSGVSYWVENGKYAVGAEERAVIEELLTRLAAKTAPTKSLGQVAAFREAKPLLGSGVLEFFARISNVEGLADESSVSGVKVGPMLSALKLESLHALAGHITLEGSKTRIQGALLGNTSPGSFFDLWGDGQPAPATLSFVSAGAISYTSSQINFPGIYTLVKRMVHATFPQTQQGDTDLIDTLGQAKLGMPVTEALGLFTGEFAWVQTDPRMETSKQFYLLGIRKKPETLKLIHVLATDNILTEKEEGGVDFLKLSLTNNNAATTNLEKNSWHMAVTDDVILFGANRETLRKAIAGKTANSSGGDMRSTAGYSAMRAQYPEKLNSLSFYNFGKVDWAGLKERWIEESKKSSTTNATTTKQGTPSFPASDWLTQIEPEVFTRHLHFASGASWKDATGILFEEWIE